jgi:hypothetical protein
MLSRVLTGFAGVLMVAAVACVGAGGWLRWNMTQWLEGTLTTTGTVVAMNETRAVSAAGFAPQVSFSVPGTQQSVSFVGAPASVQHWKVGDTVTVLYHPNNPSDAGIQEERAPTWTVPLLFFATGLFVLIVGALTLGIVRAMKSLPSR